MQAEKQGLATVECEMMEGKIALERRSSPFPPPRGRRRAPVAVLAAEQLQCQAHISAAEGAGHRRTKYGRLMAHQGLSGQATWPAVQLC